MITLKSSQDIKHLKKAGLILASVLDEALKNAIPGANTLNLDMAAEKMIRTRGCVPAFKNYKIFSYDPPYPSTLCTSINDEVVHAPARDRILKGGDIIGIDVGLEYKVEGKSYFVDMAKTKGVGEISDEAKKLMEVTKECLRLGIEQLKPGNTIGDIGKVVQGYAEDLGYSVVRDLVGHGVGFKIHEEPSVPNYVEAKTKNIVLQEGMVLAIEPMINIGEYRIKTLEDGWTIATEDGSLSAHFEHTVAVTKGGYEILTSI
jgi:methionyl aminopeptidase